ncbi:MAG: sigma-70 family RNA polymerase sigma factor, partial [Planctomycetota bacterium]
MMPNPPHIPVLKELEADSAWLVRVCRRLLMRGDEAEDLVQEAWLLANRGAEAGQAPVGADRARPWLVETVKRLSWNANRREALRSGLSEVDAEELVGEAEPAGALERAEFRSKVAALVMELPAAEREAIVLRFYEGLATAKIMEETGAPSHDAVRQRISRGIAKLRHRLDESGGRRDWQRSATAIVMASSKAVQGAKGGALALALVVGFIGALVGGAILLGGAEGPRAPQTMVSGDPGETPEGGAALESLAAVAVSGLREVNPPQAGAAAPAGVANEGVTIRMVDAATGEPVANQRWFVIRTGEHDYGRAWGLGPQEPNPKPVAEGVTDENGNLRFAATEDALVNLCTDRSDEHARGSWAVRVRDGMAEPAEVQLSVGTTFRGRVVNDVGEPLAGLALATHSYADEWIELGLSDEAGRFELARCADF